MRFWDSSALVPLLIEQEFTLKAQSIWKDSQSAPIIWWGSLIECFSALTRLEREQRISAEVFEAAQKALRMLSQACNEIQPTNIVREKTLRLLRVHSLRAADAQQLAAALIASEDLSSPISFVCFDERLAIAARREGFTVLDQASHSQVA